MLESQESVVQPLQAPSQDQSQSEMLEKKMMEERDSRLSSTPVAIVGMASLLPRSEDLAAYWNNILREVDCITEVPDSRWDTDAYYDPNPRAVDKTYCKRGGFVPDIDFNPMEFGLPPNVLEATDISQLLSLVIARQAMDDAGYGTDKEFSREKTGVVLGAVGRQLSGPLWARLQYPVWERVLKSSGLSETETQALVEKMKLAYISWQENSFPGMLSNVISGRITNRFDFGGLNCTLDAACASSLAALRMAIDELTNHRADMMLTGGVDPDNSAFTYLCFSKTPALSLKQASKPFDVDSDGIMLGEGVGMVVLKRLADAERDGDRIYAVIKGLGTSSDGRYKSIYAPRPAGQVKALERAYEDADISPATVGLVEAHGTGTKAGDPAEFEALKAVFAQGGASKQSVALGSVKSQIGHTKTAAGVASLIKTALALHHKVLPPTINVSQPSPKLKIEDSPFYLNTKLRPWILPENAPPRRAGVSSFGFGGTNFHVVLEEYQFEQTEPYRVNPVPCPVMLFADTPAALLAKAERVMVDLRSPTAQEAYIDLVEASRSQSIPAATARVGFVADDLEEATRKLKTAIGLLKTQSGDRWEHPQGIFYRSTGLTHEGEVVALFSGQGSQYLDMGQTLAVNFPEMRRIYGRLDRLMAADGLKPISEVVYARSVFSEAAQEAQVQQLRQTEYAQPAIGAFSAGLYQLLSQAGFKPDFVAGHSFGELTALLAAGVLSEDDYCKLVKSRGQAMAAPNDSSFEAGTMLAVQGDVSRLELLLQAHSDITIANFNSPQQVVLAGSTAAIAKVETVLQAADFATIPLPVSAAFHTELVGHAQAPFAKTVEQVTFKPAQIPVYANVTGALYPAGAEAMKGLLKQQMTSQVKFKQEIESIYAAGGRCFVEFGPKRVLTNLVSEVLEERPHVAIALNASRHQDSDRQLREAVVKLRVAGLTLANLDPYQLPLTKPKTVSKGKQVMVKINGASYVSEKTKVAFEEALSSSPKISLPEPQIEPQIETARQPEKVAVAAYSHSANGHSTNGHNANGHSNGRRNGHSTQQTAVLDKPPSNGHSSSGHSSSGHSSSGHGSNGRPSNDSSGSIASSNALSSSTGTAKTSTAQANLTNQKKADAQIMDVSNQPSTVPAEQILKSLDQTLAQFGQHQSHISRTHEQYLDNHRDYTQAASQLMQQQQQMFTAKQGIDAATRDCSERSLMTFHNYQQETLRVHERYLTDQLDCAKHFFELGYHTYQGLMVTTTASATAPATTTAPATAPAVAPTKLSTAVALMDATPAAPTVPSTEPPTASPTAPPPMPTVVSKVSSVPPAPSEQLPSAASPAAAEMESALLAIVSDKTGYPVEMLELDMDMEADLGIDSIKRVEILGALQDAFPALPQPDMEELAEQELRTLAQVADFMRSLTAAEFTSSRGEGEFVEAPIEAIPSAKATLKAEPAPTSEPVELPSELPSELPQISASDIQTQLLTIVSDKTGYPVEMLEPDMDMEADLGIDSIKRVEILGALQDAFPELPQPDMEELAEQELRTLAQVASYMQSLGGGASVVTEKKKPSSAVNLALESLPLPRLPAQLQHLPTPDWWEMSQDQICVLTNDGSAVTAQLAQCLLERGWKVAVLGFPTSLIPSPIPLPDGVHRFTLAGASDAELGQSLDAIAAQIGTPTTFIHLHPSTNMPTSEIAFSATDKAIVKQVFFMAKHLKKFLNQSTSRSAFFTIARLDGAFGLAQSSLSEGGKPSEFSPIPAGLFGLTKTLGFEWPSVFCRAMDLSPTLPVQRSVDYILAELHDPNRQLMEVAYGPQGRTTLIAETTKTAKALALTH